MKKIFLAGIIAASLVACNNSAESTDNQKDSLDSLNRAKNEKIDSSAEQKKDMNDSLTEKKKDSLDKQDTSKTKK